MEKKDSMKIWNSVKQPPADALKEIKAGRLKGYHDINPVWRYQIMTELFGACGIGWRYDISRVWQETASEGQIFAFAEVKVYIRTQEGWSEPTPGIGGSMLIAKEKAGLYSNDEAYKMAITDALSVALKMLGVGADIYAGKWDGTKYQETEPEGTITIGQAADLDALIDEVGADRVKFKSHFKIQTINDLPAKDYHKAVSLLEAKRKT